MKYETNLFITSDQLTEIVKDNLKVCIHTRHKDFDGYWGYYYNVQGYKLICIIYSRDIIKLQAEGWNNLITYSEWR